MTTYEKSSKTSREWTYTGRPLSSYPEARNEYSGFCPILPMRLTGISDFDAIRSATRTYITKHTKSYSVKKTLEEMGIDDPSKMTDKQVEEFTKKQNWTFLRPNSDRYWNNVNEIRVYFQQITKELDGDPNGFVQPMRGNLGLDIDIVCPSDADKEEEQRRAGRKIFFTKQDVDNCVKPILDALDFRAKTNEGKDANGRWKEGKKLGLVVDDEVITNLHSEKHQRRDDEVCGFYWRIYRLDGKDVETEVSMANRKVAERHTTEAQRAFATRNAINHSEKWEECLNGDGFDAKKRSQLKVALLANDDTPLAPVIAQHYIALARIFDRNTAATMVYGEHNQIAFKEIMGIDADELYCEIEHDVEEFANDFGIEIPQIDERTSIRQLNAYL